MFARYAYPVHVISMLAWLGSSACTPDSSTPIAEDGSSELTGTSVGTSTETSTESSTTTASSTETETETGADSEDSAPDDDMGTVPSCDPFAQDCPEGEKCVPYAPEGSSEWSENRCVPISGDAGPGEPCTYFDLGEGTEDCGADSWCLPDSLSSGEGTCRSFCSGSFREPTCAEGFNCVIANSESIVMCVPACDPLLVDSCAEDDHCILFLDQFSCFANNDQTAPTGEPCGPGVQGCFDGHCAPNEAFSECFGERCCADYCDISDPQQMCATPEYECVPLFEDPIPDELLDYADVGACVLPGSELP